MKRSDWDVAWPCRSCRLDFSRGSAYTPVPVCGLGNVDHDDSLFLLRMPLHEATIRRRSGISWRGGFSTRFAQSKLPVCLEYFGTAFAA